MSFFDKLKALFGGKPPPPPEEPTIEPAPRPEPPPGRRHDEGASRQRDLLLEREARALFDKGERGAAIALLDARAVLIARHDPSSLPCLCRKCLRPEPSAAEAKGVEYVLDFVVAANRALFYWTPAELKDDVKQVRASMRAALRRRLRVRAARLDEPRQTKNPFTNEEMTLPPSDDRRRWVNPLNGRVVR